MDTDSLAQAYPWLNVDGIAAGCRGLCGEGWLDPYSLLMAFRKKAISQGARYLEDEAISTNQIANRVASVGLAKHGEVSCSALINAAGPSAGRFASLSDIALPVTARKRNVFVFDSTAEIVEMPLVVDPANIYVRPEGNTNSTISQRSHKLVVFS